MMANNKKKLSVIIIFVILVFSVVLFWGELKGVTYEIFAKPSILKAYDYKEIHKENKSEEIKNFYKAYKNKESFYGLKQTRLTLEGTTIFLYIATIDGNITVVFDFNKDSYSNRGYRVVCPKNILLGYCDEDNKFYEIEKGGLNSMDVLRMNIVIDESENIIF